MLEAELSTDESEREDDDYEAQCLRYGALVRRVLRSVPDLDAALPAIDEVAPGHTTTRQSTDQGLSNGRTVGVGTNGVGDTPTRTAASAPRRVFFYNFAPSVTSGDVTSCSHSMAPSYASAYFSIPWGSTHSVQHRSCLTRRPTLSVPWTLPTADPPASWRLGP